MIFWFFGVVKLKYLKISSTVRPGLWFNVLLEYKFTPVKDLQFSNRKWFGLCCSFLKGLIVGLFWWKLHVRKSSSSGVMAKNVNFEKSAKNGKNGAFSCFSPNSEHSFILIFFVKLEAYKGLIWVKTACWSHIRFFSYGLKRYRPIRLHGSSNCNISRTAWPFELIFCILL